MTHTIKLQHASLDAVGLRGNGNQAVTYNDIHLLDLKPQFCKQMAHTPACWNTQSPH